MTSIQLTLTGAQARAEVDGLLTAGMVGVPVTIAWDESWNGLVKTLVCRSDGCIRTILNVGSHAMVAPEVFRTERWAPNALYLGVEGRDAEGKLVIPSTFAYCGQILPGAVAEGTISQEPENPAWAQILGLIGDMGTLATAQKGSLVEAINEAAGLSPAQGAAASVSAGYQLSPSHDQIPTGTWSTSIPAPAAGKYLWTKITLSRGGGASTSVYSVSGGVTSVNGICPDSTGNIAMTAAQAGAVPLSGGTMTGPLNLVSPTASAHGATKSYVDTSSRKASPYNLLDNSDFRNPVNQRGQSSYTGIQYTIDRWRTWSNGNVTVGDGYINKGNESLWQYLPENAIDGSKKYTIALCTTGGTKYVYSGTPSAGFGSWGNTIWFGLETPNWFFRIENGMTENIAWVALYEGEYTAETLPEYHPKGYTVELAECQRYYIAITDNSGPPQGFGFATTSTNVRIMVPLNVQMRMDPTVIFKDGYSVSSIRLFSPNGELNPTEIITISARNSGLHFQLRVSNATVNSVFVMRSMGVECSADL